MKFNSVTAAFYLLFLFAWGIFITGPGPAAARDFQNPVQENEEISPALKDALGRFHYRKAIGIIEKEKYSPALEFLKAGCYKKLYALDSASAVLQRILRADSSNVKAWAELGEVSLLEGNYVESVRCYTRILEMDTANIYFELQRAMVYAKSRLWSHALAGYEKVLATDSSRIILCMAADACQNMGKDSLATELYDKVLRKNPVDLLALNKISAIFLRNRQYSRSILRTEAYLKRDSTNVMVRRLHGMAKCLNEDYPDAIKVLGKLAAAGDQSFITNYYLGISEYNQQLYDSAFQHLFIPYLLDSTDRIVRLYLGNILCMEQETAQEGIAMLQKGIELMQPDKLDLFKYHNAISKGYYTRKQYGKAVAHLQKAYENNPRYILSLYSIARLYDFNIRNNEKAVKYYRDYLKKVKSKYKTLEDDPQRGIKIPAAEKSRIRDAITRYEQLQGELFMQGIEIPPLDYSPSNFVEFSD